MRQTREQPLAKSASRHRFSADTAGAHWEGSANLAQAAEAAELTRLEAEAARLAAGGHKYRAIALALAVPYPQARRVTLCASNKLRRAHPGEEARQRQALRDLLMCLRNRRSTKPAPVSVYARMPGGGWEASPVGMPATPWGGVAEDLLGSPLRFVREFARHLAA